MRKYTKAVSATLAGALAVGMVPAMALADEVELQGTADLEQDMARAGISAYADGLKSGHAFTYDAKAQGLVPTAIYSELSELTYGVTKVEYYKVNASGAKTLDVDAKTTVKVDAAPIAKPTEIGKYVVVAYTDPDGIAETDDLGDDAAAKYVGTFSIVGQSLKDGVVYEVDAADEVDGVADAGIVYDTTEKEITGADGELNVMVGSTKLALGSDYEVTAIYNSKKDIIWPEKDADKNTTPVYPSAAGKYYVDIEGMGVAYDGQKATLSYEIQKLDLAAAAYAYEDVCEVGDQPTYGTILINGDTYTAAQVDLEHSDFASSKGARTVTVSVDEANAAMAANAKGSKTLDYVIVNEKCDVWAWYGTKALSKTSLTIGAEGKDTFVPELVTADAKLVSGDRELDASKGEFDLVVMRLDANGQPTIPSSVEELQSEKVQGTYKVYVKVDPSADTIDYDFAGMTRETAAMTVVVDNGDIVEASVAYVYNGKKVQDDELVVEYDGKDVLDSLKAMVETSSGVDVAAGDYEIVVTTDDAQGNPVVVDEIVDAGTYELTIKSDKYDVVDGAFTVQVNPAKVSAEIVCDFGQYNAIATGEAIDPIEGFWRAVAGKKVGVEVPADAYKVTVLDYVDESGKAAVKTPAEVRAAGTYTLQIADAKPQADNWAVAEEVVEFVVTSKPVFVDVPGTAWYADEVYAIASAGVMTGYGAGVFGPLSNADREEVAVMMSRLAKLVAPGFIDEDWADSNGGDQLVLPFDDFDGGAWYAEGVYAMYKLGVMGVNVGDEYGIDRDITRQELITALKRFDDKALGVTDDTILAQAGAFDAYVDGDEVAGWAAEGMAWGVENGLMGVNTDYLNPTDPITRAELAAVFTRYMDMIAGAEDAPADPEPPAEEPEEPTVSAETLQDALDAGGDVAIDGVVSSETAQTANGVNFGWDFLMHDGGTLSGGTLNLNSASRGLFINNENNWPEAGDGANAAFVEDMVINAKGVTAVYVQAVDAPVTLENVEITADNAGLYVNTGRQAVTLKDVVIDAANNDTWEGEDWFNTAVAVATPGVVVIESGTYEGVNAVYVFSTGGSVTIEGGTFYGKIVDGTSAGNCIVIKGGTFDNDPGDFVANGFEVVKTTSINAQGVATTLYKVVAAQA